MKKALISLLIVISLSAGIFFSAGSLTVKALETNSHVFIHTLEIEDSNVYFEVENPDVDQVIVEYSFLKNDILFSKLDTINVNKFSVNTADGLSRYHFVKPYQGLSLKIWRIIDTDSMKSTINGEYIYSPQTSLSAVQNRVKQIIVDNDLITKEGGYTDLITDKAYTFYMHFDLIDEEGNNVPIDNIIRLSVSFDIVQTGFLINKTIPKEFVIEETSYIPSTYFPFFVPGYVQTNIKRSFDSDYTWMVNLGTYLSGVNIPILAPGDVTLDKTQLLTIDYVYDGVFYEDQVIIDEPYDKEDVLHVNPGTTDPYTSIWDKLETLFANLDNAINVILMVVIGFVAILAISLIAKVFTFVKFVGKMILKIIKFILDLPGYFIKFILFLIIPKEKRKERINASRYL